MTKIKAAARAAALLLGALLAASACQSSAAPGANDAGTQIRVVAAESVWGALASAIGGAQVQVTSILGADSSPSADVAAYRPNAADAQAVAAAKVFILNGAGLDPWAAQAEGAHPGVGRLEVNVGDQVGVSPGGDAYLWTDPLYVRTAARQIEADFAQLRPADATQFQQNEQGFENSQLVPDEQLIGSIKSAYQGTKVGVCDALGASLAGLLGLKPDDPPTSAQLAGGQVRALLCDAAQPGAGTSALLSEASAAQIPVVALTVAQPAGADYQQWQSAQLQSLQQALSRG